MVVEAKERWTPNPLKHYRVFIVETPDFTEAMNAAYQRTRPGWHHRTAVAFRETEQTCRVEVSYFELPRFACDGI